MPQRDIVVPGVKVKDKSIFSLEELYKAIIRWLEFHRYTFQEQEYREEDLGGGKKHLELKWYAEKKIDDYIKFVIEVNFLILGLEKLEAEVRGVREVTNKGELEMNFKAYLLKDYDKKWERTAFMRFLRETYDKKLIKTRLETYEGELYEETYKLMDEVRAFLNMHRI